MNVKFVDNYHWWCGNDNGFHMARELHVPVRAAATIDFAFHKERRPRNGKHLYWRALIFANFQLLAGGG